MNQRTNKQPQLLDNRQVLYHIKVDKNISNLKDFLGLIYALMAGYCNWRDRQHIICLLTYGVPRKKIAAQFDTTYQNIINILSKSNNLIIDDNGKDDHVIG